MTVNARSLMLAGALTLLSAGSVSAAQPRQPRQQPAPAPSLPAPPETAISAGQIQRWFEAFTVLQAQDALQLSEAQYGPFVTRLKALQEVRRRHQQARAKMLADLRRLTNPETPAADAAQLTERLKALRDHDDRGAAELRKAYDGVDETLDVRQQARFRIFEERMEQQKLDLLMRARQNARALGRRGR